MNEWRDVAKLEVALMNEIIERLQLLRADLKPDIAYGVGVAIDEIREMIEETSV